MISIPERLEAMHQYHRDYHRKNPILARYKSYKSADKGVGRTGFLTLVEARHLMGLPCHYCKVPESGGLDRMDCSLGHTLENVLPCCEKCNNILGDLPQPAKELLASGLAEIRTQGLFNEWVIPTKRRS